MNKQEARDLVVNISLKLGHEGTTFLRVRTFLQDVTEMQGKNAEEMLRAFELVNKVCNMFGEE